MTPKLRALVALAECWEQNTKILMLTVLQRNQEC